MFSLERALTPALLRRSRPEIAAAPVVMLDGNLSADSLQVVSKECLIYRCAHWARCYVSVLDSVIERLDVSRKLMLRAAAAV